MPHDMLLVGMWLHACPSSARLSTLEHTNSLPHRKLGFRVSDSDAEISDITQPSANRMHAETASLIRLLLSLASGSDPEIGRFAMIYISAIARWQWSPSSYRQVWRRSVSCLHASHTRKLVFECKGAGLKDAGLTATHPLGVTTEPYFSDPVKVECRSVKRHFAKLHASPF
jgi:hypothetical protein